MPQGDKSFDQYSAFPITGQIVANVTGTLVPFSDLEITSVQLIAHPSNAGLAWLISKNGSIGYPLKAGQTPLFLDAISDLSDLSGWFDVAGDKICFIAQVLK